MAAQAALDRHRVSAIIVSHDGQSWLPQTVAALASQTRAVDYVVAVDTGSKDSSLQLLKSARIRVINAARDCGFGEAISIGVDSLDSAQADTIEWIWLIHDDCAPAPTALEFLLAAIDDRPQVAMVGPKLLGWHNRTHLLEVGVSIAGNGARWTGLEPLEYDQGQHDGVHDVLSVSTAGALIRRDIFEEIGGFDKNLALFRDDVDFGWRARVAGHSVIAASSAVVFHAQASATERRSVDVGGAILQRPLLLDRRNAAYVLLANSSWWLIPWLAIQLLSSAMLRAIGYLLAKLPGYASDELLAIATLLIKPGLIIKARRNRKAHRFVSARIVSSYIPPRWSQLRLSTSGFVEALRSRLLPESAPGQRSILDSVEDEDLLVPAQSVRWFAIFRRPEVTGFLFLAVITLIASRMRLGSLIGGALPASPSGARDLWQMYFQSWHQVGMGSSYASPPWIAVVAVFASILFGKAPLLLTLFFLTAPLLMMWSILTLLRKLTQNPWISVPASFIYAISPVAIAAVNSGRLATVVTLIIAPQVPLLLTNWKRIELQSWRKIFTLTLLVGFLYAFTLIAFVTLLGLVAFALFADYKEVFNDRPLFLERLYKRAVILFVPFILNAPYSFQALTTPSRFLSEPGVSLPGGGSHLVILGNPGGVGALPWWLISPMLLILVVALFSSSSAKTIALYGSGFLSAAVFFSSLAIATHGDSARVNVWTGTFLVGATIAATAAGVVILDRLRAILVTSNFHFRHILAALLLFLTALYTVLTLGWSVTAGATSPVQSSSSTVMPAFLSVEKDTKTLVLREMGSVGAKSIQYYISRGKDIILGEPDVAPRQTQQIAVAAQELIDGSGISSSKTFADFGIKYVFVKLPFDRNIIRTIDGLGGFSRASATSTGVVWRVAGVTGRLILVGEDGVRELLETGEVGARTTVAYPGRVLLTENYDRSWQILQNGYRLQRVVSEQGLPLFIATESGEISLIHDGTIRRAWISFEIIAWVVLLIFAAPAGRRKREIFEKELA
ncbi:MAG: glycosyltransferase family 2 protein [Actinomycetota bacterium]|nr:glycosyltransferase family 2 protein [Actinomycetota bacterium]